MKKFWVCCVLFWGGIDGSFGSSNSVVQALASMDLVFRVGAVERPMSVEELGECVEMDTSGTMALNFDFLSIQDLHFLEGENVAKLSVSYSNVETLSALQGLPLQNLQLAETMVRDLSPLAGMPLEVLDLSSTPVTDLRPLSGMELVELNLCQVQAGDLSPLQGMPIRILDIDDNMCVSDLEPLRGMPLTHLKMSGIQVNNLEPLCESPLEFINLKETAVTDLRCLKRLSLTSIQFTEKNIEHGLLELRGMKTLESINHLSAKEFWSLYDDDHHHHQEKAVPVKVKPDSPRAMEAQQKVDAIRKLAQATEVPNFLNHSDPFFISGTDEESVIKENYKKLKKIAAYLGWTIRKERLHEDPRQTRGFEVEKRRVKMLNVDPNVLKRKPTPLSNKDDFDVSCLLEVLPKLSLKEGYCLDYIYLGGFGPGRPMVYGRKVNAPRLELYELWTFLIEGRDIQQNAYLPYLSVLRGDGSDEGFVQLALFDHLCEQFYGGYMYGPVIASHAGMAAFLAEPMYFMREKAGKRYGLEPELQKQALALDPCPAVARDGQAVSVMLTGFSNWKGFYKRTITYREKEGMMERTFDWVAVMIPYNCGIIY